MITIQDLQGNDVEVPVQMNGGMVDCMLRADTKEIFEANAKAVELLVEHTLDDGATVWKPAPGIDLRELGAHTLVHAVTDDEGNVTTPAVMDNRYHVNMRLGATATARGAWKKWAIQWSTAGSDNIIPNNTEIGKSLNGISLIDPITINNPVEHIL